MELKIEKIDQHFSIYINGTKIPNVQQYQLKSSESGETELQMKLVLTTEVMSATLVEYQ